MDRFFVENEFLERYAILPRSACEYIGEAGPDELRALIFYLSRNEKSPAGEEELKEAGLSRETFFMGLSFWKERGVIGPAPLSEEKKPSSSAIRDYGITEAVEGVGANPKLKSFIEMAEKVLSKPLTSTEVRILYGFCDELLMTPEAVILLLQHCCSQNKKGIRYIEKVARGWSQEGILTHEAAVEHIKNLTFQDDYTEKIRSLMGIRSRAFSPSEQKYIEEWRKLSVPGELLELAYDKTVVNTGKVSFAYMNTILMSWRQNGVKTKEEAERSRKKQGAQGARKPKIPGNANYDKAKEEFINSIKNKGG